MECQMRLNTYSLKKSHWTNFVLIMHWNTGRCYWENKRFLLAKKKKKYSGNISSGFQKVEALFSWDIFILVQFSGKPTIPHWNVCVADDTKSGRPPSADWMNNQLFSFRVFCHSLHPPSPSSFLTWPSSMLLCFVFWGLLTAASNRSGTSCNCVIGLNIKWIRYFLVSYKGHFGWKRTETTQSFPYVLYCPFLD